MKNKEFHNILENSKHLDYFCGMCWYIPSTYFTKAITIDYKLFNSYEERENFLKNRKHKWWEKLPIIHKSFWVNY